MFVKVFIFGNLSIFDLFVKIFKISMKCNVIQNRHEDRQIILRSAHKKNSAQTYRNKMKTNV